MAAKILGYRGKGEGFLVAYFALLLFNIVGFKKVVNIKEIMAERPF
jgi:hypothetical protein